jgi:hypothetical protein
MTTRAKVLLLLVQGLTLHLFLVMFAALTLSPNRNMKTMTAMVIPFGRLNFDQVTSLLAIEWLLVFILWILFAFFLFRQPRD